MLGTLWPVSDAATALLIARFYELHMGERLTPPAALRRAQQWLRRATNTDLAAYARLAVKQGRLDTRHVDEIDQELSEEGLTRSRNNAAIEWVDSRAEPASGKKRPDTAKRVARPYAHPYFWAGSSTRGYSPRHCCVESGPEPNYRIAPASPPWH